MLGRIIASITTLVGGHVANLLWNPQASLMSAEAAGNQFIPNDAVDTMAQYAMGWISSVGGLIGLGVGLILLCIWFGPVVRWFSMISAAALLIALSQPQPAAAFFSQTDKTEAYTVLPNQSAFWIPNQGDNKNSQVKLDSEDYLNSSKVAAKLFIIPHVKFTGSGGTSILSGWDYFVPSGRLIIVDRTPYSREWVKSATRGTSKTDDSFPCQSKEGLNITVGVSIGTSVSEDNAAKFLYNFGVKSPSGDTSDPVVIFTSVYYGRSLADVMDDVVRKKVQTLVCNQIASRSFDGANAEATTIMDTVQKATDDYLKAAGITLNFIGWADTFEFDPSIQEAINRRYIAEQDKAIASALAPYAGTIQSIAVADAIRGWGAHSDGKFPTTVVGYPSDIGALLTSLLHGSPSLTTLQSLSVTGNTSAGK